MLLIVTHKSNVTNNDDERMLTVFAVNEMRKERDELVKKRQERLNILFMPVHDDDDGDDDMQKSSNTHTHTLKSTHTECYICT